MALRDEPLALWAAAAEREERVVAELNEPEVALKSMTQGSEVVQDYGHMGLTLRGHPVSFLRDQLTRKRIVSCAEAMGARDGRWLMAAGLVLVRQKPGSANVVVWPGLFEKRRKVVLGSSMMAINGKVQREGEVVHLVAQQLFDLSEDLSSLGSLGGTFPLQAGRGDEFARGAGPDPRERDAAPLRRVEDDAKPQEPLRLKARNFQ
jgi:error-prone DNA polymerase